MPVLYNALYLQVILQYCLPKHLSAAAFHYLRTSLRKAFMCVVASRASLVIGAPGGQCSSDCWYSASWTSGAIARQCRAPNSVGAVCNKQQ